MNVHGRCFQSIRCVINHVGFLPKRGADETGEAPGEVRGPYDRIIAKVLAFSDQRDDLLKVSRANLGGSWHRYSLNEKWRPGAWALE
jgi:hypothetical protein